jgi:hypothetical protein
MGLEVRAKDPLRSNDIHKISYLDDKGEFYLGDKWRMHSDLMHAAKPQESTDYQNRFTARNFTLDPNDVHPFDSPQHVRAIISPIEGKTIIGTRPYYLEHEATPEQRQTFDRALENMIKKAYSVSSKPLYITTRLTNQELEKGIETIKPEHIARMEKAGLLYRVDSDFFKRHMIVDGDIKRIPRSRYGKKEFSIGISPASEEPGIQALVKAGDWEAINKRFQSDAYTLLESPKTRITEWSDGVGVYGGTIEPSPRLLIEHKGDYKTLESAVSKLGKKWGQKAVIISELVPEGSSGGTASMLFKFKKNLSKAQELKISKLVEKHGLGSQVAGDTMIVHDIDSFHGMSDEDYAKKIFELYDDMKTVAPFESKPINYIHDVITDADYDSRIKP